MKKITQNLIQSIWRSGLLAFVFLCSLSINSQTVGQEYLVNPGVNSAAIAGGESFVNTTLTDASVTSIGWGHQASVAFIDSGGDDGDCHSEDRQFRLFKKNPALISQDITIPAGDFNWSFYTKWGAVVDYDAGDAEKPTFTIETDDDDDDDWTVVKTVITTEPTAVHTWVQQTGTYSNDIERIVRIKFSKDGGTNAAPTNLQELMFVDDVSLKYAGTYTFPVDDTSLSALTQDGTTIAGFTKSGSTYDIYLEQGTTVVPTIAATTNSPSANLVITAATSIPGTTTILVTAEDATTSTVSINFSIPVGVVGQEYLVNPNVNSATGANSTTPDTGVDGSGNIPTHMGGWGTGANGSYAPTSASNGDCHSEDRMFKFFKKNDAYVTQTVTLPAGIYSWSFWTRWAALVNWDAAGDVTPKFTIMTDDDVDGIWTADQTNITTQPTVVNSWVQQTGTYTNSISRLVKIKFSKSGGTDGVPTNLQELMYIDDVSLKFVGSNDWTGTTDTDWDTATNWRNGVPGTSSEVFIPGGLSTYPTASSAVTVSSLTMGSGASLMTNSDFTGAVTYNRTLGTNNWYLVSSPVVGQDIDAFVSAEGLASGTGSNVGLSDYNNATPGYTYYQSGASGTGSFTSGDGRSIKLASAGDVSFTGTINTNDVTLPMISNSNGFNLVGNPYPSYLAGNENADGTNNILTINSANLTENTLWFWNQNTDSYNQINQASAAFQIAPAQGFFLSASGSVNLSITEAMQSHQGTDNFQKTTSRPEMNITMTNGTASRDADIFFIDGTTTGFDNGYDSSIFGGVPNEFAIYTHAVANGSGRNLGIQSLPNNNYENMIVPVGVNAASGSAITIEASTNNFPEGLKIFLEDKQDNSFTLLDADANFNTTLENDLNGIGRFYLHTNQSVLNINDTSLDNVSVFKVNNSLRVLGLQQGKASVKLFNILGRQVLNAAFESNGTKDISLPRLAKGVYIVQLETAEGKLNKKIILE